MKINLPATVKFRDYHEGNSFLDQAKKIIPCLRIKEIGYISEGYTFLAYTGTLKDKENVALLRKIRKQEKQESNL